ncbi:hypothetical protein LIA77_09947 [Sarocladium implicatum]|nr:hypothetical protein LIA77_09947 [Sarocladium implicatum]
MGLAGAAGTYLAGCRWTTSSAMLMLGGRCSTAGCHDHVSDSKSFSKCIESQKLGGQSWLGVVHSWRWLHTGPSSQLDNPRLSCHSWPHPRRSVTAAHPLPTRTVYPNSGSTLESELETSPKSPTDTRPMDAPFLPSGSGP